MSAAPEPKTPAPLPVAAAPKFHINQPPRPLLSRDADSMYWMSRYVERAEHVARILLVNSNLLTDVGDLAPNLQQSMWQSVLKIMRLDALPAGSEPLAQRVAQHMAFNRANPNSLVNCLTRARENAHEIREAVSAEMWESLNTLYWSICGDDAPARFEDSPDDIYRQVMNGSMLFQGLTDQTLGHDQRWFFTQLAKYLERTDVTCRILGTRFDLLRAAEPVLETPLRNIHWMAVLRTCCSIEAYRRNYFGDMDPLRVAAFLVLERAFPRSVRFSVGKAHDAIAGIRAGVNPRAVDPAERILGRLDAQLEYAEISEIIAVGVPAYLQKIQDDVAQAALAVQKAYFLH